MKVIKTKLGDIMEHFVWNIAPQLAQIGPFEIRYYGLLFACGFLVGYQIMQKIFIHEKRDPEDLSPLLTHLMLGTIIGARLGHCLFYEPAYYLSHPLQILMVWKGGLASHGGGIGVITSVFLYCKKHKDQPFLWLSDRIYIGLMFTGFCIRLGNFFNSEIVGLPSNVAWAVVFERIDNIPRHPAQLYESLAYLVGFFFIGLLYLKNKEKTPQGKLLGFGLIWTFTARFILEFFKENQVAFEQGMLLNMGQILSIPYIVLGILLFTGLLQSALDIPTLPEENR